LQQKTRVPRPRDFYDVWMLLKQKEFEINGGIVKQIFLEKCKFKNVPFNSSREFFTADLMEKNKTAWESSIGKQVEHLSDFKEVIAELSDNLSALLD